MKSVRSVLFEKLIPLPQSVHALPGCCTLKKWKVYNEGADQRLRLILDRILPPGWQEVSSPSEATLALYQADAPSIPRKLSAKIREESYRLEIEPRHIHIQSGTSRGLYYGLQTLHQLLVQSTSLPCGVILDWPDMELRGMHIAMGDGHMPRYERLLEIIRRLASFKFNNLHVEYDACFTWEKYPFIAIPSALTKDQCRNLVAVAKENFVELIPTVDSLGHQELYICHDQLKHLRELPHSHAELCASNPQSLAFIKDLWREVLEVHAEARYVNITGDETFRLGAHCPRCSEYAKNGKLADLFFNHYNDLCQWMLQQGHRPMMWHDMLANHPERLHDYPKELMVLYWNYWGTDARKWEVGHGLPAVLLPEDIDTIPARLRKLYEPYWKHQSTAPDFTPWPYLRFFTDQGFDTLGASAGSPVVEQFPFAGFRSRIKNVKSLAQGVKSIQGKGLVHTHWSSFASIETAWADIAAAGDYTWHSREESIEDYLKRFDSLFLGSGGRFPVAAQRYDELIYPETSPGFNHPPAIQTLKKEMAVRQLWHAAVSSCRRNAYYMDSISPSFDLAAARHEAMRGTTVQHTSKLGRGRDFPIDLSGVFTASTRRVVPSETGSCLNLPSGQHVAHGIVLQIGPTRGGKHNAIMLKGEHNPLGIESVTIPLGDAPYDRLFFWHTAAYAAPGTEAARYELEFANGAHEIMPVVMNHNIGDWYAGKEVLPAALVGWQGFSNAHDRGRRMLYLAWWKNSSPARPLRQVTLLSGNNSGHVALVAMTGRILAGRQPVPQHTDPRKLARQIAAQEKKFKASYRKTYQKLCVPEHIDMALNKLAPPLASNL